MAKKSIRNGKYKRKPARWNLEACKQAVSECSTRSELAKKYSGAHYAIRRNGWEDETGFSAIPDLSTAAKKSDDEFAALVHERHGDKYDVSNSKYVNNRTKIDAVCKHHGPFLAMPYSFLNGIPCPDCRNEASSKRNTHSIDDFVKKYVERFGNKYDFSKSLYVANNVRMTVTCPEHGDFEQTPNKLLGGRGCPICTKKKIHDEMTLTQEDFLERIHNVFGDTYDTSKAVYTYSRNKVTMICKEHGEFQQPACMLFNGYGCPHCAKQTSKHELEIVDFVESYVGKDNVVTRNRSLLNKREVDILVESKKFAIEYNGNYWHCEERGKDRKYHVGKTDLAESKGYRLIQIFQDEYAEHKELVLDKISHFLGCDSHKIMLDVNECYVIEIDKSVAKAFIGKFDLEGLDKASKCYGAFHEDTLVSVMTFLKSSGNNWNLNHHAVNIEYSITGIENKIFKHFLYNNDVHVVTASLDRRWGKAGDNVYEKLGFTIDKITPPDYRYLVHNKRVHKFNFRKATINKKYGLPMTMTETEMVKELGISRIWDCGLIKYVYKNE